MTDVPPPSLRDPAGYVEFTENEVLRRVHSQCSEVALRLLRSPVAGKWQLSGLQVAVIHYLLLMDQIPLKKIAALTARLTRRHLLLEWVPQTDTMFRRLLRGRETLYEGFTAESMQHVFSSHLNVIRYCELANGRSLYLMEKR